MSIIECKLCGTDTAHDTAYHYTRPKHHSNCEDCFLLMFFKTPFVYRKDGKLLQGEQFRYLLNIPYGESEHKSTAHAKTGFVNDWIFFSGGNAAQLIEEFSLPVNEPFYIDTHSLLFPYIRKIATEQLFKHPAYESKVSAIITEMLVSLGRQYDFSRRKTHAAFAQISNTRNYMLDHMEQKITIADLAQRSNYSESRFLVLYRNFFSASPMEELLGARIEKAVSLLEYSSLSITEIAKQCGFSSIHYFSRKFNERTGVSPTRFSG